MIPQAHGTNESSIKANSTSIPQANCVNEWWTTGHHADFDLNPEEESLVVNPWNNSHQAMAQVQAAEIEGDDDCDGDWEDTLKHL
jgi:hypothetical protein